MRAALTALVLISIGCLPDDPLAPPAHDVVFVDRDARVELEMIDRGGFPDRVVDFRVELVDSRGRLTVMGGTAQVQSVRGRVDAARLRSGALAVARGAELCSIAAATTCAGLDRDHAAPAMRDALAWRAASAFDLEDRARAALALVEHDRGAALEILRTLDASRDARTELDAELRGVRARLEGDRPAMDALRAAIPGASGVWLAGLARACVPSLERDVRGELRGRSDSVRALVEEQLARCLAR